MPGTCEQFLYVLKCVALLDTWVTAHPSLLHGISKFFLCSFCHGGNAQADKRRRLPAARVRNQEEVHDQLEAQAAELRLLRQQVGTRQLLQLGTEKEEFRQRLEAVSAERDELYEALKTERNRHGEKDHVGLFLFSCSN